MIDTERHTESQRAKIDKARRLISKGWSIYSVSDRLNVGFSFIRAVCRDLPGAAERDLAGRWLPDDDEANVSRDGLGYWVPSPEEITAMMEGFDACRLKKFQENSKCKRDAERYAKKKQEEHIHGGQADD